MRLQRPALKLSIENPIARCLISAGAVAVVASSLMGVGMERDSAHASSSAAESDELETIEFEHPISAEDALQVVADEGLSVYSFEFLVGNGVGHHVYDPTVSTAQNVKDVEGNLADQAPGGKAAVTKVAVLSEDSELQSQTASDEEVVLTSTAEDVVDEARARPQQDPGEADLTVERDKHVNKDALSTETARAVASDPDLPETRAHPNSVWMQTNDNVNGKRQLILNAQWLNESNTHNAPVHWWGSEFQLYQHNNNLSGNAWRPICPADTDDRYWADGRLTGATLTMVVNDGTANDVLDRMETYVDSNHFSDPCDQAAIGFGIGKPTVIPDMNSNMGDPGMTMHQSIYVDMRLKPGDNSWSHVSAATKYVQNNCQGHRSQTDCMGLSIDPARPWPSTSMGGGTDMLLLNREREWKTPTHFSWDEYADKRPKLLQ